MLLPNLTQEIKMSKLSMRFLQYTFGIMLICWGTCWICSDLEIYMQDHPWLYPLYLFGGWSPTIASYIVLKQFKCVNGFKKWIGNIFCFHSSLQNYCLIILMAVVFLLPQCVICGYESGAPLFTLIFMLPMMLFGGGLEEAGWRYILQPELEKRYGFVIAALITGVIWWLWHLPLFHIQGVAQYGSSFWAFGVNVLALSFALAMILKQTKNVWLCILFHCVINSLSGVYIIKDNILGNAASLLVTVAVSVMLVSTRQKQKLN